MNDIEVIYADPWLKKADKKVGLPGDACFACSYELDLVVDQFEEAAFFRRTETRDELWIGIGGHLTDRPGIVDAGCVFAASKQGEELTACLKLMELFFRARHGFEWPGEFISPGMINKTAFDGLIGRIESEYEENRKKAASAETEIITVARKLGLFPQPTGDGPSYWQARCPERNHPLYINAAENSFGCGWCRRKGGVEDLQAFAEERKGQRP